MDVEFDDGLVHFERLGKANGFALQSLEMSAKVEVFALNVLSAVFANAVTFGVKGFAIAFPIVGSEVSHITRSQFVAELSATGISASSQHKSRDVAGMTVQSIPKPALLPFVLHKRPLFIDF